MRADPKRRRARWWDPSWVACLASTCLVLGCREPVPTPPVDSLLITGVSIVDPSAETASPASDVLVAGGVIVEIAPAGSISPERAARQIPAEGLYALPGLIDVHAHLGDGGIGRQTDEDRRGALRQFVDYGVTTIFVPGGGGGNDQKLGEWKRYCAEAASVCPNLFGSGALITAPGSHPIGTIWGMPDDTDPAVIYERGAVAVAEDAPVDSLIDTKVALGVDAVKIVIEDGLGPRTPMPRLSKRKIAELVDVSHRRGLRVFAHVSLPSHVADGVDAGIDGVMHSSEEPLADSLLATMAEEGVFYVATLALYQGFIDHAHQRWDFEPFAVQGVSPRALASLEDEGYRSRPVDTPEGAVAIEAALQDNLRRAAALGVPLALGTDVNNPRVFPGYSAHQELALMVAAGLTPARALAAATEGGAAFLGQDETLGKLAPGYRANLLLLEGNPLADILNTRSLRGVLVDGVVQKSDATRTSRGRSSAEP
ncbi:MAG: amidohydrolase family protein [Acidobacteriota bacterium]